MPPLTSAARPGVLSPGPVELLTWPQRRIRLFWSTTDSTDVAAPTVDGVLVCNGDPVDSTMIHGSEMMTPWRFSDPQKNETKALRYVPQTLDKGRAMWRSLGGILPNAAVATVDQKYAEGAPAAEPARTVEWLARLVVDEVIPGTASSGSRWCPRCTATVSRASRTSSTTASPSGRPCSGSRGRRCGRSSGPLSTGPRGSRGS
ncbi:hypothetical protein CXF35_01310 [Corynebacterium bovis]|nr:hypothetical protein CXF40_06210 [Corynebacterium bovis]RRO95188.1 hypothetical protein CXF32_07940 [Corynebacterium bovis]RRO98879.1 hypothetical protein CXF31_03560 [Corynebacterium bovis]RRQ08214.1 hypothetical protein CXF34_08055 [Corynebacterium bovis]RRQ17797.1 hypothetical protein CXF35_01310 [Corynebacterium bovis]